MRIQRNTSHVKILVRQGQRVNQGDVIGRVGSVWQRVHMCVSVLKNGPGRRT
jgi:murein DD-endopeptidase MepM/ murein hydrolase activator NlpD